MLDADTQPSLTKRDIYTTSGTQLGKSTNGLSSIRKLINDDDNDSIDDNASTSTIDTTGCHPAYAASTIPSDVSPIRTTNATTIEKLPSISSLHSYTSISTSQFSHYTFLKTSFFGLMVIPHRHQRLLVPRHLLIQTLEPAETTVLVLI